MKKFEYEITTHTAETFSKVIYFCSESGACSLDDVPEAETDILSNLLNERGDHGWELIQFTVGKEGLMAFWKRHIIG